MCSFSTSSSRGLRLSAAGEATGDGMTSRRPVPTIIARSTTFRSSRMFPGHEYCWSAVMLALFALAETYDPFVLSEWKTFGTQGDAAKARELYTRALAGGVTQAKERLKALR